jgi:DMSO/TMAO reductase YedYZ heme-binding membrane subunit
MSAPQYHGAIVAAGRESGWWIVGAAALAIAAMVAALLAVEGLGEIGVRAGIRWTARTSVVLFSIAFAASSANALWRTRATKWVLRNRRYIGVSFAVSHFTHLALIGALASMDVDAFIAARSVGGVAGGGLAYLFIAAMVITSFDRTARWLGRRRWRILHTTGMYVICAVFAFNYAGLAVQSPAYIAPVALLTVAIALRVIARLRN